MFFNNETDYAIRIVSCLAEKNEKTDAATISEQTGVTLRFALKILHRLVLGGIVKSFKGNKGGYMLAKDPSEITLLEVVEKINGPVTLSRCHVDGSCGCTHPNGFCNFKNTFLDVTEYIKRRLSEANFSNKEEN